MMATSKPQAETNVMTGEVLEETPKGVVVKHETHTPAPVQTIPASPAEMVMWALEHDKGLDVIDALMDRQDRHDAKIAEQAFNKAMAEFKRNPPTVIKDKKNTQYGGSGYVSRGNLVNTVNAALGQYGLSATWDIDQSNPEYIKITCILKHELGHSTQVTMAAPPDDSGKKNPIQQIKSTKTYLEVATYESVTGVVATDEGDDDGNSARGRTVDVISEEQLLKLEAKISDNYEPDGAEKLKKWIFSNLQIQHLSEIRMDRYTWVMDSIDEALAKRKAAQK